MRTMYDSVTAANLPVGGQLYAYYVNGLYANGPAVCGRFPGAIHVAIAVSVAADAQVLDVETGDATPDQGPAWCRRQRARGQEPTVYCNTSTWPAVVAACRTAVVDLPQFWEAHYDGVAQLSPGSVAKQYLGSPGNSPGPYDVSCVADYWPGVDPPPSPTPSASFLEELLTMAVSDPGFAVRFLYRFCLHREADAPGYTAWVQALQKGASLDAVMATIEDSPEGKAAIAAERKSLGLS